MTMVNRTNPKSAASEVFTDDELELLDRLCGSKRRGVKRPIARYVIAVAKLGGYLARAHDLPPGDMVLWRGIARLNDIHLGYELHRDGYG